MTMRKAAILVLAAALAWVPAAVAETVELRTGGTLAGEVRLQGEDGVVVKARFPEEKEVVLKRGDLTPESLYEVLERRIDPSDAAAHRDLGALAEKLGLHGAAVAEYRSARDLDAAMAADMDAAVARVLESLAANLVEDAREELDRGRPRAALRYLHEVIEKYPKSKAAADAKALMPKAHEAAGRSAGVAEDTVPAARVPELLESAGTLLAKADGAFRGLSGHGGSTVKDQRASERAVRLYEAAWREVRRLPVALEGDLAERVRKVRERARASLVEAYLTAGTIHLQRRSLPAAEEYCNRACELDPENRENHDLHRLILEARSLYYGTVGGVGR